MMTTDLSRQFATGVAAFFLTAMLILANAPSDTATQGLQLSGGQVASQVRTVLNTHG